jgi:hypothetical protein
MSLLPDDMLEAVCQEWLSAVAGPDYRGELVAKVLTLWIWIRRHHTDIEVSVELRTQWS